MPISPYLRALREKIGTTLLEVPTAAAVVFDNRDRVLLVKHHDGGQWTTPGGILEPHETPADAAVRETWEETGVMVELTHVIGVFGGPSCETIYSNGDRIAWVATVFAARIVHGEPRADGEETLEARFVERGELATLSGRPHLKLFLDAAFDHERGAYFEPPTWRPEGL